MVRLNRQSKECKRVMVIDATDYPLVRVIKPLPSTPDTYKWAMWAFTEIEEKGENYVIRKNAEEMAEGSSFI